MKEGVVVLGHGSRRKEANQEIIEIAKELEKKDKERYYQVCFLQFGSPSLDEAIEILVKKGVNRIIIVPLFLTVGRHINEEIPTLVSDLKIKYPFIDFFLTRHIGVDPKLIEIIFNRVNKTSDKKGFL